MMYIVGLGNPGEEYAHTRHNVGFMMLDALVRAYELPPASTRTHYAGNYTEGVIAGESVALLYPTTFMNHSGSAVKKLVPPEDIGKLVVIYDDVDIAFGEVKISTDRGSGGHNGVASIIDALKTKDFARIRVGITPVGFWSGEARRPEAAALSKHVLGRFSLRERAQLAKVQSKVKAILETVITEGVAAAMNRYN